LLLDDSILAIRGLYSFHNLVKLSRLLSNIILVDLSELRS
jgi:hypothetical protein